MAHLTRGASTLPGRTPREVEDAVVADYERLRTGQEAGLSLQKIAQRHKITKTTVVRILRSRGVSLISDGLPGEAQDVGLDTTFRNVDRIEALEEQVAELQIEVKRLMRQLGESGSEGR